MNRISQLVRLNVQELPLRKKISGVNMQTRKEIRRIKKLNIYSREFTGIYDPTQANKINTDGSHPAATRHSDSIFKQPATCTRVHSPSSPNSRRKSAKNLYKTRTGSTTSSATT